jgi:hypothetical protein
MKYYQSVVVEMQHFDLDLAPKSLDLNDLITFLQILFVLSVVVYNSTM